MITPSAITDVACALLTLAPDPANPTGARTFMEGGRVCFENAGYRITVGDDDTVFIANLNTGEEYLAWGPPQMWVDGDAVFDFWGSTTLALEDGTKVTIHTVPWSDDPLVTISDKVTISNHDYGVEVMGLASCDLDDLRYVETQRYGWLLDAVVGDGNLIVENAQGAGFVGENADSGVWHEVDQAYIDATDLAVLGPLAGTRGAAFLSIGSLLAITFIGAFRGPLAYSFSVLDDSPQRRSEQADLDAGAWRLRLLREGPRVKWCTAGPRWGRP